MARAHPRGVFARPAGDASARGQRIDFDKAPFVDLVPSGQRQIFAVRRAARRVVLHAFGGQEDFFLSALVQEAEGILILKEDPGS